MEYLQNLEPLLRTFWYVALGSSLVFVFQTIMTFVGGDATDGLDADFDGDMDGGDGPFQLFSFRNLVNFLLGLSWGGISFYDTIASPVMLITVASVIGIAMVAIFFVIITQLQKLQEDNSFKLTDTINKTGEVYLNIPEKRSGMGKISISVGGAHHELQAISEKGAIDTGTLIKVVRIESDNILVVETFN